MCRIIVVTLFSRHRKKTLAVSVQNILNSVLILLNCVYPQMYLELSASVTTEIEVLSA